MFLALCLCPPPVLPHATQCGAAATHAAAQGPGSPFVAVTANKDYLKTPRVRLREGIRSPGVSPSGTSKRLRVGDMRPLNLSGLHEADKKKVRWLDTAYQAVLRDLSQTLAS